MPRMIRKQLYLELEQQRKLRNLATRWGCTEAGVIRRALDQLPDPEEVPSSERAALARLAESGVLVHPLDDDDAPTGEELKRLEREWEEWVDAHPEPLGLGEIVLEDRR